MTEAARVVTADLPRGLGAGGRIPRGGLPYVCNCSFRSNVSPETRELSARTVFRLRVTRQGELFKNVTLFSNYKSS